MALNSKPSKSSRPGGYIAGTKLSTDDGAVSVERLRPGDRVRSLDNQSGQPTHRQIVAVHRCNAEVWLIVLKRSAVGSETDSAAVEDYLIAGVEQAFLVWSEWKRTDQLVAGDRLQLAGGTEACITLARPIFQCQYGHAGWAPASAHNMRGAGFFVQLSRQKLLVERRHRAPRVLNFLMRLSSYLFTVELDGGFGVYFVGPQQVLASPLEIPALRQGPIQAPQDTQEQLLLELLMPPFCVALGAAITYLLVLFSGVLPLPYTLLVVWFSGVVGGCSGLLLIAWGYLLLKRVVLHCLRVISRRIRSLFAPNSA